jgi:hypothetical protein
MGWTCRPVHDDLITVAQSVQQLFAYGCPVKLLPIRAAFQALLQPPVVHDPVPNQEIKIVPSVVF